MKQTTDKKLYSCLKQIIVLLHKAQYLYLTTNRKITSEAVQLLIDLFNEQLAIEHNEPNELTKEDKMRLRANELLGLLHKTNNCTQRKQYKQELKQISNFLNTTC